MLSQFSNFECVWWLKMDYKHTCDTILHSLLRHNWQYLRFWKTFFAPSFFTRPPDHHPYFDPLTMVFTHSYDGWTGLCMKLWVYKTFGELPSITHYLLCPPVLVINNRLVINCTYMYHNMWIYKSNINIYVYIYTYTYNHTQWLFSWYSI